MTKKLNLNQTVFELTQEYPELVDILAGLGFTEITKKFMLQSVGKIMTIPRGAEVKKISMMDVVTTLKDNGFELVGEMPGMVFDPQPTVEGIETSHSSMSRTEQLKTYLKRLGDGEALEKVRADFVRDFEKVEASEIMQAEQELLKEGTPLSEVQRLCDVHSALFHGATAEEQRINVEKEVGDSILRKKAQKELKKGVSSSQKNVPDKNAKATELETLIGHPLYTLTKENKELSQLLKKFKETRDESLIPKIRELSIHYAKKGDLLYPLLKVQYGISGPSDVMWTVDDEIREELGLLAREVEHGEEWHTRLDAVLTRAQEMIYKEQNILFPICAVHFTQDEWVGIYHDSKDYAVCLDISEETWEDAENVAGNHAASVRDEEIFLPGGHLTIEQLSALLRTIPMEITFVDAHNINRYFNEGPKVFKRPAMALDREVFSCHPPKIEPMVRRIIDDFRNNRSDLVPVWMEKGGHTMLVQYMAVRDKRGEYIGTLELVQDMEFAKEHFLGSEI